MAVVELLLGQRSRASCMEERCGKRHSIDVERFPSLLFPGTVVTTGQAQECALTFYMFGNQEDRVMFTGLTAEELARRDTTTIGDKLTCACVNRTGLAPLQWLDGSGTVLPNNNQGLVDYKAANRRPGSAVNLRINQDGFSCAEAGEYTCVVGTNTRTVLVTPIGECVKQCRPGTQLQHTQQCLTVLVGGIPAQHTCDAWRVCL